PLHLVSRLLPHTGRSSALPVRFRRRLSGGNSETFWRRLLVRMLFPPSSTSPMMACSPIWHRDSGPDIRFAWEDCRLEFCNSPLPYPIRDRRQLEALVTSGIVPASELRLTSAYLSRNRAHVSWFSSLSSLKPPAVSQPHRLRVLVRRSPGSDSLTWPAMQQLRLLRLTRLLAVEPEELAALSMERWLSECPHQGGNVNRKQPHSSSRLPSPWPAPVQLRSGGCRYVLLDDKEPACLSCFDSRLANTCAACERRSAATPRTATGTRPASGARLLRPAGRELFSVKSDAIYCLMCYETRFAERCSRCREAFKAGQRKFEFRRASTTTSCFLCCECGAQIGGASFIPRAEVAPMTSRPSGVSYKGRPYHSDCLVCGHCAKALCGLKFTSHEDRPFCGDCYGELFARRCSACLKPITASLAASSSRSRQRDWHSQCFNCARCGASLVGKGFLADGEKVVCTPSAAAVGGSGARQGTEDLEAGPTGSGSWPSNEDLGAGQQLRIWEAGQQTEDAGAWPQQLRSGKLPPETSRGLPSGLSVRLHSIMSMPGTCRPQRTSPIMGCPAASRCRAPLQVLANADSVLAQLVLRFFDREL
uniref:LIM zinc-binding domain-containing protein n=1 Tax=Macrostomum lignano TaxID=282301 RepID=A0A1I8FFN4_9PLAT